jgi:tripartite ATP-independent transporter DctM subunit
MTLADCVKVSMDAIPSLSLIVIVIGGILGGVFTATEASAIAVVYALFLSLCYRSLELKKLPEIFLSTAKMSAIVIFMLGTSSIMSWVMAFTQIPGMIAETLLTLTDNPIVILLIINVVLLFIGTFMDPTPAVLIFTPIFLPICMDLGMDPVQFGILLVFNLSLGTITPPVGPILFTGCKVSGISIDSVVKTLLPFFLVIFGVLMLVTYIPAISMTIPELMGLIK